MKKIDLRSIDWKQILPYLAILVVFVIASLIYFWPAAQGKIIESVDGINGRAAVQESIAYHEQTGDYSYWTNSIFGGMPNYQIGGFGGYKIDRIMQPLRWFFSWGNRNAVFIFLFYLCAFFILLRSFKVDKWLSMAGAFAISLSSYFFVIIAAMHHGKCYSITWMTLVIVGFILTYRKQYGWGALLVMFFTYIGFFLHPQMSYYICMLIGVMFFAELAIAIRDKEWKHFGIATAIFFASFGVGMGMGSANVFVNKEYAQETMRGGHSDLAKAKDESNKTEGLDLDYATAWSYGINETMTFLIPNYMGGASGYNVGDKSVLYAELVKARVPKGSAKQFCKSAPTYWGEKAFTSGPVYMGAIICFLFVLALLIVPGPYKWALLAATLFSLLLSWGRNMMWLTELFFKYFPMYNKFRAVESILIVAEITMPLLAFLGVQQLIEHNDKNEDKKLGRSVLIAGGVTAFICLVFALFGSSISSFTSSYDSSWKGQVGEQIYQMIIDQRVAMMSADAWRSFIFIALATGLVWFYTYKPFRTMYLGLALTALIVADMWTVDKRFCNDSYFHPRKNVFSAFKARPYEQQILDSDKGYYRVMDISTNTFNDARPSYHFHSIGGYSAAKLRRYQDLIDEHISKMNWKVINMLNTKYLIVKGNDGRPIPYPNPEAFGPCWFVDKVVCVGDANAESAALNSLDLRQEVVMDSTFAPNMTLTDRQFESGNRNIEMQEYRPNRLTYKTTADSPQLAVLSEIYYPYGWKATIDGVSADIYRVNYMLRAIKIPDGEHELILTFEPESVKKGNILSLCFFAIMLLTLIGVCGYKLYSLSKRAA